MLVAGLPGGEEVLAAVLHPLHRRAELRRRQHQAHLVALHHDLLAEATPGVAHHDADAVLGDAEQPGAEHPDLVRRLRRRPDRDVAPRPRVVDDEAASLHRDRRVRLLEDRLARYVGGGGEHVVECRRGQAADLADEVRAVGLVDVGLVALGRHVVDDRLERLVVDVDHLGGVLREVEALGDDERDRVTDEAHLVVRQWRTWGLRSVATDRRVPLLLDVRVQVGGGEHRAHAGHGPRRGRIDAPDAGAGERTAHERRVQHPGQRDVVDVGAVAGEEPGVFDPGDTRPGVAGGCGHASLAPQPPSTGMHTPLTKDARSDERKAATSATSEV